MFCLYEILVIIILYILIDMNYLLRIIFSVLIGRLYQRLNNVTEVTTIYGMCTFQDCDLNFKHMRMARLIRDLDFARYHFYDRTGIYEKSRQLNIKSLQGCTFSHILEPIPLFVPYKINTKLVYWDNKSLFFEHIVVTLRDNRKKCLFVSRQHALCDYECPTQMLIGKLIDTEIEPICPEYIECWFKSAKISSALLRPK